MYPVRHNVGALAVDSQSKFLVVGSDKAAHLIDTVTAQTIRQWHGHTAVIQSVDVLSSPTRGVELVATSSYDASVCLWDGRTNNHKPIQTLKDAKDSVSVVKINPAGSAILTASVDGCLRIYDVRNGQVVTDDFHSPITDIAISALGSRTAVSCLDGGIRITRNDSTSAIVSLPTICRGRHKAGRYGLRCCYVARDSLLATGSEDGRVVLYDSYQATPIAELLGHTAPTCSVAAFGEVVVTASYDGNCIVWANNIDHMRWNDTA
jgi:mitogen-activated protein kinase organizer 1